MISSVAALEWDNRGNYDDETRTMEIRNSFGFGQVISKIKLNTPLNFQVPSGYTKIAEIEIINNQEYSNALQKILFYDIDNNMDKINRNFDYKVKEIKEIRVKDYKEICNDVFSVINQTMEEVCSYVEDGGHFENRIVWTELDKSSLRKGTLTIGIFTDVKINDKVEWVPTFFGIEIDQWAVWTESLSVGLELYYNFNQTSGTLLPDVVAGVHNGTLFDTNDTNWVVGKLNNALFFDGVSEFANTTFRKNYSITDNFTINFWYNTNNTLFTSREYFGTISGDGSGIGMDYLPNLTARFRVRDNTGQDSIPTTTTSINTGLWVMQTLVRDTARDVVEVYINGVSQANFTDITLTNINFLDEAIYLGARNGQGTAVAFTNGSMDEMGIWNRSLSIADVLQLFNDGDGLTFPEALTINLDSPDNNTFFVNNEIPFTCIATNHILLLQNITFILDGVVNETKTISPTATNVTETFTQNLSVGAHNWTCEVCDTDNNCLLAPINRTLSVTIEEVNQLFSVNTTEGNTETFSANILLDESISIILAELVYNGTRFIGTSTSNGNDTTLNISTVLIPVVSADVNLSFFWDVLLSTGDNFNLTTQNQTIIALDIDNCSSFTNTILNFTNVDENLQTLLVNSTMEISVDIFSSDGETLILNTSGSFTQNPSATCLNSPITNETNYLMDVIVRYEADDHAIEFFNIRGAVLDDNFINQNITLFDILTTESTEFQITFKNSDFVVQEGALIQVNRQYISEGVFKTVELPITDSNGQTVVHLVKNDVVYNYIVTLDNVVIGSFNNLIAFCEDESIGQCFISLNALQGTTPAFNPDINAGISFLPLSFNETSRDLSFTFVSNDGTVKTVLLNGTKFDQLGEINVCSVSLVSSSGTLVCNIAESLGNETIVINVFVNGELSFTSFFKAGNDIDLGFGGFFILLFLVITLGIMFSESKSMMVGGIMLGFIIGSALFLISGSIIAGGSALMWLIINGVIILWKLQSEGQT